MSAIYVARLAPLDQDVIVRTDKHGLTREHFHQCVFALERKQPNRVKVCLDHDDDKPVGHLDTLARDNGWLTATFRLDERSSWSGVAEDRLTVGCPVSISWSPITTTVWRDGIQRMLVGELHEVSIVNHAAIPGAKVLYKWPIRKQEPSVKPMRRAAGASPPATEGQIIWGDGSVIRRTFQTTITVR